MKKLIMLLFCLGLPVMANTVESGLAVGERTPAYNPQHVTGPDAGTDTCPV